jgi:hypothetical protein
MKVTKRSILDYKERIGISKIHSLPITRKKVQKTLIENLIQRVIEICLL